MADLATSAIQAVRDYEHWHQEVARLSGEIGGCECPNEVPPEGESAVGAWMETDPRSCFRKAREDEANWTPERHDESAHPPTLATVARVVAACPSCSRLCVLIAERKVAKQKRGAAKRYVRRVGKMALREAPHG